MSEWPKELASKASMGQPIGGSNPSTTAPIESPAPQGSGLSAFHPHVPTDDARVTARPLGRCHGMTKTQRMLAAFALAGAAAGLAAPAASAAPLAPLTLPDLPTAPGMPAGAQPASVQEIGAKVAEGANQLNQLMEVVNQTQQLTAPVQPAVDLLGGLE